MTGPGCLVVDGIETFHSVLSEAPLGLSVYSTLHMFMFVSISAGMFGELVIFDFDCCSQFT